MTPSSGTNFSLPRFEAEKTAGTLHDARNSVVLTASAQRWNIPRRAKPFVVSKTVSAQELRDRATGDGPPPPDPHHCVSQEQRQAGNRAAHRSPRKTAGNEAL